MEAHYRNLQQTCISMCQERIHSGSAKGARFRSRGYDCNIILQPNITKEIKILRRARKHNKNLIKYLFQMFNFYTSLRRRMSDQSFYRAIE